jgi:phage FluMu gp28-like protein
MAFLGESLASFPRFCGLLKIPPKSGGARIPLVWSPIQRHYHDHRSARDIILKPRQVYMTTLECARDLWWFVTKPGARVLVVCQSQSGDAPVHDISEKFRIFFDCLESYGLRLDFGRKSATEWTLPKRDAIMRLLPAGASAESAERKGRAGTVNRAHFTEMAFWGAHAADTFSAIAESVSTDGSEIVNESTANGAEGLYYHQWRAAEAGTSAYAPHFFPWYDHPWYRLALVEPFAARDERESRLLARGVSAEALSWYRNKILENGGDVTTVRRDYPDDPESCFLDTDQQYIQTSLIEQAVYDGPPPLIEGRSYAGLDIGLENDLSVLLTVKQDRNGHVWVVDVRRCPRTNWDEQMAIVIAGELDWRWTRLAVDRTGIGRVPAEMITKKFGRTRVDSLDFTLQRKGDLATGLYQRFADGTLHIPDHPELVKDLRSLRRVITKAGSVTYDAPRTKDGHADTAWALALAVYACSPVLQRNSTVIEVER